MPTREVPTNLEQAIYWYVLAQFAFMDNAYDNHMINMWNQLFAAASKGEI